MDQTTVALSTEWIDPKAIRNVQKICGYKKNNSHNCFDFMSINRNIIENRKNCDNCFSCSRAFSVIFPIAFGSIQSVPNAL